MFQIMSTAGPQACQCVDVSDPLYQMMALLEIFQGQWALKSLQDSFHQTFNAFLDAS
jgi:hypothetical protein